MSKYKEPEKEFEPAGVEQTDKMTGDIEAIIEKGKKKKPKPRVVKGGLKISATNAGDMTKQLRTR